MGLPPETTGTGTDRKTRKNREKKIFWHSGLGHINGNGVLEMGGRERREVGGEGKRRTLAFALVFSSSSLPAVLSLMLDCRFT